MPTITRFEEIEAWKTARELTKLIYSLTEQEAFSRDFGLKDQIRLYVSHDLAYVTQEQFTDAFRLAEKASRQISRFIAYLENRPQSHRIREESPEYEI